MSCNACYCYNSRTFRLSEDRDRPNPPAFNYSRSNQADGFDYRIVIDILRVVALPNEVGLPIFNGIGIPFSVSVKWPRSI